MENRGHREINSITAIDPGWSSPVGIATVQGGKWWLKELIPPKRNRFPAWESRISSAIYFTWMNLVYPGPHFLLVEGQYLGQWEDSDGKKKANPIPLAELTMSRTLCQAAAVRQGFTVLYPETGILPSKWQAMLFRDKRRHKRGEIEAASMVYAMAVLADAEFVDIQGIGNKGKLSAHVAAAVCMAQWQRVRMERLDIAE